MSDEPWEDDQDDFDPVMPLCPVCFQPMKLEDRGPGLKAMLGIDLPEEDTSRYKIVCCGYQLRMENSEMREAAVRALREYHQYP